MKTDHWPKIITLLSDLVVHDSYSFKEFLSQLMKLILKFVPVDSCFIYIYDETENDLILMASKKPHVNQLGKIKLKKGEGITGWVAEKQKTVVLNKKSYKDKRFKSFNELPEDMYEAFLSVPITYKSGSIGVINLQNKNKYVFKKEQIETLEAIVKIVSAGFATVVLQKKVDLLENQLGERKLIEKAKGILMEKNNLSESEAYSLIRQEAMKKRKSKSDIAEAIILVWG